MTTSFLHGGKSGDIISALPLIRAMGGGNLYLEIGKPAPYPLGSVFMTPDRATKLLALLEAQQYLGEVDIWMGQEIDIDLGEVREQGFDFRRIHLARSYSYVWPCVLDLATPWLRACPRPNDRVVINWTPRYTNDRIDWKILRLCRDVLFVGEKADYAEFSKRFSMACDFWECAEILELADLICGCRFFVGGQSLCWWIAEALKVPRCLIACPESPNSSPSGFGGYEVLTQSAFEWVLMALEERPAWKTPACGGCSRQRFLEVNLRG